MESSLDSSPADATGDASGGGGPGSGPAPHAGPREPTSTARGTEAARALVACIGSTPLLPLPSPDAEVRILGKAEWLNPGGSVKDRAAWRMVRTALTEERLTERRLLDASSGNTAIAFAMLGGAFGFGVTICLPANASDERKRTLRAYGADLVLTDPVEGSDGAIRRARAMAEEAPGTYWYADQYSNPDNPGAHYATTGPEVWKQTDGELTHFVAGLGTGGTLTGAGRYLRERSPAVRIVAVEPDSGFHGIEGLKHMETALRPEVYDPGMAHETRPVSTEEAQRACRRLAREHGLFVGLSSGAAHAACRRLAGELDRGTVVTVLPDAGSRYLGEEWWSP